MRKKLIYLISFVLVLSVAGSASAALVAHWQFNNNGTDSVGTLNWTLNGGAGYSTDAIEGSHSLMLDGTNDYAGQTAVGTLIDEFSTKTVMIWFKADSTNGTQVLYDEGGTTRGLTIRVNNGNLEAAVRDASTQVTTSTSFSSTDWSHVAASFDNGLFILYLNGKEVDSITAGFTSATAHSNNSGIGARNSQDAFGGTATGDYFGGLIDDVQIHDNVLSVDEIRAFGGVSLSKADEPSPADEQTDLVRNVTISWKPGEFANTHDVYFGTNFDDVNNAANLDPMGPDSIYRARESVNSYAVPERLNFEQTYYWRIDEVNAPPTSHVVFKGDVWSFTVEPVAYPIAGQNIIATASSSFDATTGPEKTVDGSGLDANDLHSVEQTDIWLTDMTAQPPIWIQYEFDKVYKLHEMWIWNFNQMFEVIVGFGLKDVTIEYSADGTDWTELAGVPEFAQAPGIPGYAHDTTVAFGGVTAKHVRITANDNWGFLTQYGLSEIRFLYTPVWAKEPEPASGATNVPLDVSLGFRAGREAVRHDVYLSADEQAVIDGTAPVATVTEAGHGPLSLDLGKTYYWRVDEANDAETPTSWQGDVWGFTTQEYLVVEDFEAYDDYEPNRIFDTWTDGWGVAANGGTIGYPNPIFVLDEHFVETAIVHSGSQSSPLFYDNTAGATYSEATRTVDAPRDWTQAGVKALTLWFYGDPNNSGTEQMYVKVNGSKVIYDGDADNITRIGWQIWYIDLADFGVNLSNVTELSIGFERGGMAATKGVVYFDDIRLYSYSRQLITPAEPNTANLVGHWKFDDSSGNIAKDSSGNGNDGTIINGAQTTAGQIGKALLFDEVDDHVVVPDFAYGPEFTLAFWFQSSGNAGDVFQYMFSHATVDTSNSLNIYFGENDQGAGYAGKIRTILRDADDGAASGALDLYAGFADGNWHHYGLTVSAVEGATVYINGILQVSEPRGGDAYDPASDLHFGGRVDLDAQRFFGGALDDVRIYGRALSWAELAALAGRTQPFDKPFRSP